VKVLITTLPFAEYDQRPLQLLGAAKVDYVINPLGRKVKPHELNDLIADTDILIAGTEQITDEVMGHARNLKLITRVGIGLDSVDLVSARRRGIEVCYTPDAPSPAVAELTIGFIISLLRSIHLSNAGMRERKWQRYFGRRLSEVTIGIIGVGRIGSRVIQHLKGFECTRILVNDVSKTIELKEHPACKIEWVPKDIIYKEADVISLHVPLNSSTRNMITMRELYLMKRDSCLINTARGGVVNEQDLFEVMRKGHLGGAAIDVFEEEPYVGNLVDIERCILSAHMGSMSVDCRSKMEIEATEEVIRFIRGRPLMSKVPDEEYEHKYQS